MQKTSYSPGTLNYIPFFYVIWADNLLSISEVAVVRRAIKNDPMPTLEDKALLLGWLDRENPPLDNEIKNWKRTISNSGVKLVESEAFPLSTLSQKIVCHYAADCPFNENLKEIEVNLGIQPNHYRHLFEVETIHEGTSHYFDATEIDKILKGNDAMEIDRFRKFLSDPIFNWKIERDKSVFRRKVLEQVQILGNKGYGAIAYPRAYGGKGDMSLYASIFETLMFVDGSLTIKFGVQFGLFGGSIQNLGTKKHHDQYLRNAGSANLLGCFAMTESRHGSNVRGIKTTATYDKASDSLIIHTPGQDDNKVYIGNALHATMASVFAQLIVNGKNEGVHTVLVPIRNNKNEPMPGVTIKDNGYKLGLNGVDNGKIWFDQVKVPRENLLNKYGDIGKDGKYHSDIKNPNKRFFTMLGTLVGGRICVAKGALSGAKMALTIAVKYALKRRQFSDNVKIQEDLIMDYPTHQMRLIPAVAETYVYHISLDRMINTYSDASTDSRKLETHVAGLKALITWFCNDTIQECREACGGKGYMMENRIADLKGDVDIFTTFEGDNTVLMQLAAKGVLSDFKAEYETSGISSVLKLLSSQLGERLSAINPLYTNKVDKDHLYDPKFHKHAFDYRTKRLTYTLAMRIRDYIKKGVPPYQAFLKVQTHLMALGKAYSIELAYTTFTDFIDGMADGKTRFLFQKLAVLYGLHEIKKDASWYLEQGYLGGTKSKAIKQRVERLSSELRPHIEVLVDGFGIPEPCLRLPILD
ncbi:acyl-CoA dehydrogenase family protein [Flavobacteriaceae bacterium F89]|uniref:acyl-CoA oxidase n=1 Tax=Cerina litoralis TaxID=2874477 RepID=A0AAE3JP20_9FLAO|nr:acyl-CoA dehydrogenase [Cerina litoralis]MCG2460334.1 acyl-CoA dehydrogenase family protein [Cerina litoralis]